MKESIKNLWGQIRGAESYFGHSGGNVKKWDKHSKVLALFVQETQKDVFFFFGSCFSRTGLSILWQRVRRLASESLSALSLSTSHSTFQLFLQIPWCDVLPRWALSCLKYFDKQHLLLQYQLDVKCLYA